MTKPKTVKTAKPKKAEDPCAGGAVVSKEQMLEYRELDDRVRKALLDVSAAKRALADAKYSMKADEFRTERLEEELKYTQASWEKDKQEHAAVRKQLNEEQNKHTKYVADTYRISHERDVLLSALRVVMREGK